MPEPRKSRRETAEAARPVVVATAEPAEAALVPSSVGTLGERYHSSRVQMMPQVLEEQWASLMRAGKGLREAGAFPDTVKTDNQAALLLLISYELDIPYTVGCRMVDIIYNRPALRGQLVGGLLRSKGCKVEWVDSTDRKATVKITRPDGTFVTNTVTIEEVAKIRTSEGVGEAKKQISLADKYNWQQQPKVMLQRFCLKQTANMFCEDIILGLPSSDEMDIIEPGRTIDVTPAEQPRPAIAASASPAGAPQQQGSLGDTFQQRLKGAAPAAAPPAAPDKPAPAPASGKGLPADTLI